MTCEEETEQLRQEVETLRATLALLQRDAALTAERRRIWRGQQCIAETYRRQTC